MGEALCKSLTLNSDTVSISGDMLILGVFTSSFIYLQQIDNSNCCLTFWMLLNIWKDGQGQFRQWWMVCPILCFLHIARMVVGATTKHLVLRQPYSEDGMNQRKTHEKTIWKREKYSTLHSFGIARMVDSATEHRVARHCAKVLHWIVTQYQFQVTCWFWECSHRISFICNRLTIQTVVWHSECCWIFGKMARDSLDNDEWFVLFCASFTLPGWWWAQPSTSWWGNHIQKMEWIRGKHMKKPSESGINILLCILLALPGWWTALPSTASRGIVQKSYIE